MDRTVILQSVLVAGLVMVHLFAARLRFLDGIPRSRWLSFAGGISVSYVFLHLIPELSEAQEKISTDKVTPLLDGQLAYLVALAGLVLFYALERRVKSGQRETTERSDGETPTGRGLFWIHISSFGLYNALIGYLMIHRDEKSVSNLLLFFIAMALHFLVNDNGLRQDHKQTYMRSGRWVLAGAILLGWMIGITTKFSDTPVDMLASLLAGGIILNVLKEELPEERKSSFVAFLSGAALYAMLLLFQ